MGIFRSKSVHAFVVHRNLVWGVAQDEREASLGAKRIGCMVRPDERGGGGGLARSVSLLLKLGEPHPCGILIIVDSMA